MVIGLGTSRGESGGVGDPGGSVMVDEVGLGGSMDAAAGIEWEDVDEVA